MPPYRARCRCVASLHGSSHSEQLAKAPEDWLTVTVFTLAYSNVSSNDW